MLDIRIPMGIMFSILGVVLTIYGAITRGNAMYATHSLSINANLIWGVCVLAFGVFMLLLAYGGRRKFKRDAAHPHPPRHP
jgi:Mn2+/Fe2+ NRAMP family transporter